MAKGDVKSQRYASTWLQTVQPYGEMIDRDPALVRTVTALAGAWKQQPDQKQTASSATNDRSNDDSHQQDTTPSGTVVVEGSTDHDDKMSVGVAESGLYQEKVSTRRTNIDKPQPPSNVSSKHATLKRPPQQNPSSSQKKSKGNRPAKQKKTNPFLV